MPARNAPESALAAGSDLVPESANSRHSREPALLSGRNQGRGEMLLKPRCRPGLETKRPPQGAVAGRQDANRTFCSGNPLLGAGNAGSAGRETVKRDSSVRAKTSGAERSHNPREGRESSTTSRELDVTAACLLGRIGLEADRRLAGVAALGQVRVSRHGCAAPRRNAQSFVASPKRIPMRGGDRSLGHHVGSAGPS